MLWDMKINYTFPEHLKIYTENLQEHGGITIESEYKKEHFLTYKKQKMLFSVLLISIMLFIMINVF